MNKIRLDKLIVQKGILSTRSQAESFIRLGKVSVDGKIITKPGEIVSDSSKLKLLTEDIYVSRAGLKLSSVAKTLKLSFKDKIVLDVGSSTGGFTDFALKNGASKVYAIDVGTNQLHPSLHNEPRIELHEQTDIRNFSPEETPDIVVMDVSFISLREILPHISNIVDKSSLIVAMCKPQFEAGDLFKHKGVIKNDKMRREILKQFELWLKKKFLIIDKADSEVSGSKGNTERFYLLKKL